MANPESVVDEFIARICRLDIDAACELVTEDVEYDNVPMGKNHGPQGIKDFLGGMSGGVDAVEFIVHRQTVTGATVMNERTDRFVVGDQQWDLPVMGVFEVTDDGLISLWRDYFDMGVVNEMMGALAG
ncbi:MAG: limonene-1,2-epoxide hydrolase family protein [Actinomycetota bacterium]